MVYKSLGDCTTNDNRAQACLTNGTFKAFGSINMTLLPKPIVSFVYK